MMGQIDAEINQMLDEGFTCDEIANVIAQEYDLTVNYSLSLVESVLDNRISD